MIQMLLLALVGLLAVAILAILILGYFWSRTEHGILDYKTAIVLRLRDLFSGEEVLTAARMREEAISRGRMLQGRPVPVAKVHKYHTPVITPALDPAHQCYVLSHVFCC